MSESNQGKTTYYLAFGNKAVEKPSNLVTLDWITCGKEELSLTEEAVHELIIEKDVEDLHTIT